MDEKIAAALRAPFEPNQIGHLPKITCPNCSGRDSKCEKHKKTKCKTCKAYISTEHIHIDYVGHADTTDRLLAVDPAWNWEPLGFNETGLPAMDGNSGMWIRLTVGGVTRLGYGHAGSKRGGDAVKEIIGDAIRNGAMRFGVALDLWRKESPQPVSADVPDVEVERPPQTPKMQCNELRGQIRAIGRTRGLDVAALGEQYHVWSRGGAILSEDNPAALRDFLKSLQEPTDGAGES